MWTLSMKGPNSKCEAKNGASRSKNVITSARTANLSKARLWCNRTLVIGSVCHFTKSMPRIRDLVYGRLFTGSRLPMGDQPSQPRKANCQACVSMKMPISDSVSCAGVHSMGEMMSRLSRFSPTSAKKTGGENGAAGETKHFER